MQNLCNIIEKWNLTQFDMKEATVEAEKELYRVRQSWNDPASQKGAFYELSNAKQCADKYGYSVFNKNGRVVYEGKTAAAESFKPYMVRVSIDDLNIRSGPGTNYSRKGYTGKGVFTIMAEAGGKGATKWGLLKAYQDKRDGWISLDYAKKV